MNSTSILGTPFNKDSCREHLCYILPIRGKPIFKVGLTDTYSDRFRALGKEHDIEEDSVLVIRLPARELARNFESFIHSRFAPYRVDTYGTVPGRTEFFDRACLDSLLQELGRVTTDWQAAGFGSPVIYRVKQPNRLVCFDGGNGTGRSTLAINLAEWMSLRGVHAEQFSWDIYNYGLLHLSRWSWDVETLPTRIVKVPNTLLVDAFACSLGTRAWLNEAPFGDSTYLELARNSLKRVTILFVTNGAMGELFRLRNIFEQLGQETRFHVLKTELCYRRGSPQWSIWENSKTRQAILGRGGQEFWVQRFSDDSGYWLNKHDHHFCSSHTLQFCDSSTRNELKLWVDALHALFAQLQDDLI